MIPRGRDRLLRDRPVPDLDHCIQSLKASTLACQRQVRVKEQETAQVNAIHKQRNRTNTSSQNARSHGQKSQQKCNWCGYDKHKSRSECPAKNTTCHNYGKTGHYKSVCRKGKVHEIQAEEEQFDNSTDPVDSMDDSTPFLGAK